MPKKENQKIRILLIAKYLWEQTDENCKYKCQL